VAVAPGIEIEVGERTVRVSNPDKVFFPSSGITKMDLVRHYLTVGAGALRGVRSRPTVMKRFPNGVEQDFFFQKRVPASRPEWLSTAVVAFPSGRTAEEICPADLAHVIWMVNLGCVDLNPWAVRKLDLSAPDELRVDLDPQPGVPFSAVRDVAMCVRDVLTEHELVGFPKTSGSRGIHINIRIRTSWDFTEVRRAALALSREVERRLPGVATTKWWKEERGDTVFLDFNQNARDRTVASAYSVRPNPLALVSTPMTWDEVPTCELGHFTLESVADRFSRGIDPDAAIDEMAYSLQPLLDLAAQDEAGGLGDAPWPPNFPKAPAEGRRVAPSRRRKEPKTPEDDG